MDDHTHTNPATSNNMMPSQPSQFPYIAAIPVAGTQQMNMNMNVGQMGVNIGQMGINMNMVPLNGLGNLGAMNLGTVSPPSSKAVSRSHHKKQEAPTDDPELNAKLMMKCTCHKKDPNRIPRPRNAFILFRQKHHQELLEEGGKIRSNPEVSRELGKRWRNLAADEKAYWVKQAEEEKRRHAEKYPNYKYTPKRNSKKKCPHCMAKLALKSRNAKQQPQQPQQPSQSQVKAIPVSYGQYAQPPFFTLATNGGQFYENNNNGQSGQQSSQQQQASQNGQSSSQSSSQPLYYQQGLMGLQPVMIVPQKGQQQQQSAPQSQSQSQQSSAAPQQQTAPQSNSPASTKSPNIADQAYQGLFQGMRQGQQGSQNTSPQQSIQQMYMQLDQQGNGHGFEYSQQGMPLPPINNSISLPPLNMNQKQ